MIVVWCNKMMYGHDQGIKLLVIMSIIKYPSLSMIHVAKLSRCGRILKVIRSDKKSRWSDKPCAPQRMHRSSQ